VIHLGLHIGPPECFCSKIHDVFIPEKRGQFIMRLCLPETIKIERTVGPRKSGDRHAFSRLPGKSEPVPFSLIPVFRSSLRRLIFHETLSSSGFRRRRPGVERNEGSRFAARLSGRNRPPPACTGARAGLFFVPAAGVVVAAAPHSIRAGPSQSSIEGNTANAGRRSLRPCFSGLPETP